MASNVRDNLIEAVSQAGPLRIMLTSGFLFIRSKVFVISSPKQNCSCTTTHSNNIGHEHKWR